LPTDEGKDERAEEDGRRPVTPDLLDEDTGRRWLPLSDIR